MCRDFNRLFCDYFPLYVDERCGSGERKKERKEESRNAA